MSKSQAGSIVKWLDQPEDHDYPAAQSYLALLMEDDAVAANMRLLRDAALRSFKAKDILRASGLPLLDEGNAHVGRDLQRILGAKPLSPLLLVRDAVHGRVIVADGYHRLCAVYSVDEDAAVPCKIV